MKLHSFITFFKDAISNIIGNRMMSLATVIILSAGVFLFGMTTALTANIFSITDTLEKSFKLQVFLEDGLSKEEMNKVALKIQEIDNVEGTEFVTKDAAMDELKERLDDTELFDGLENSDFLRNSFKVTLTDLSYSKAVVGELEKIDKIAKITKLEDEMETFKNITSKAQIGTLIVAIILALLAVFIIINTINMSIYSRKKEINIMKYVGATDWYIRWPFIIEGVTIGIISSALSMLLIFFLYRSFDSAVSLNREMMGILSLNEVMPYIGFSVFGLGIILGCIGSIISVKKHLKV